MVQAKTICQYDVRLGAGEAQDVSSGPCRYQTEKRKQLRQRGAVGLLRAFPLPVERLSWFNGRGKVF